VLIEVVRRDIYLGILGSFEPIFSCFSLFFEFLLTVDSLLSDPCFEGLFPIAVFFTVLLSVEEHLIENGLVETASVDDGSVEDESIEDGSEDKEKSPRA